MAEKISVIGGGSWGTTLAILLAELRSEVVLWVKKESLASQIQKERENVQYLPGRKIPHNVRITSNLKEALNGAGMVVTAIPSKFLREMAQKVATDIEKNAIAVSVSKGLEEGTFKRMSQVLEEEMPETVHIVVLSGPNLAEEISRKMPAATVIASKHKESLDEVKKAFTTSYFKVYPHDDVVGVEIGGALKNITAIASGVCDGLHLGNSTKGSIITLGLREMIRFGKHLGAKEHTFYGLAGVGDLVATCTSNYSRNHFVGQKMAEGKSHEEIKKEMHGMIAEGVFTAKAIYEYAKKKDIKMPLTEQIYHIIYEGKNLKNAIEDLLNII